MILVRLKLGIGVRPSQEFGSSSVDSPRCTADRVRRARIPQLLGPWSEPIRSKARRARAWRDEIDVDSIACARTCCFAFCLINCLLVAILGSLESLRETTTMA